MPTDLRFRQIHLDFHTSRHITDIGAQFDPDEFADTLEKAHVDSITCFARCHHGFLYYESQNDPDRQHPHLTRNLLIEQIEACHARDIRVPVYTTIQWDYLMSKQHPEWLVRDANGQPPGQSPLDPGFYARLAVNSPYFDWLKDHLTDLFASVPVVDGLFLDIVAPVNDASRWTVQAMEEAGLDPTDAQARWEYGFTVVDTFRRELTAHIRTLSDDCTIFYNQGHVGPQHRGIADAYTHWELESLPSGSWGYLHFPMAARYSRTLGLDQLAHTGKFHTEWGDFHSFKNPEALQFECFRMLAHNTKCMVGDQLPPEGKFDPAVYDLIGGVYEEIEKKEPWCEKAQAVVEIGVLTPEEFNADTFAGSAMPPALMGLTHILEESARQFDIIDTQSDFSHYPVLILPDRIPVDEALAAKLDTYLAAGGAVIASFESGLNAEQTTFTWDALGVSLVDEGPRDASGQLARGRSYERNDFAEFILPEGAIGEGLPHTEHVMYMRGMTVAANPGTDVLASIIPSHFDRSYDYFCSHRQTPATGEKGQPAIVQKGRVIYFSSPIFSQYHQNAPRWCKTLVLNALASLQPEPLVQHDGPSTLQVTLNEQSTEKRQVLHLLHYIPERRGLDFDTIEDVIPLYNVTISVKVGQSVKAVTLVPEDSALEFEAKDGRVSFTIPVITGHQMISLSWA